MIPAFVIINITTIIIFFIDSFSLNFISTTNNDMFSSLFLCFQLKALPTVRGGFVGQASAGIALLRMPLAGGATLGPILEHYSNRYTPTEKLRWLHHGTFACAGIIFCAYVKLIHTHQCFPSIVSLFQAWFAAVAGSALLRPFEPAWAVMVLRAPFCAFQASENQSSRISNRRRIRRQGT